ncbi:MAG: glycosyltransferase family 4 protein [Nitrospira sp.]|nr:glycosyltransferase family 4 protein [Nitrospira sp.]
MSLKIAIDVEILPGINGGVASAVKILIHTLGELADGDEQYTIVIANEEQRKWLSPYLGPNQKFSCKTEYRTECRRPSIAKRILSPILSVAKRVHDRLDTPRYWPEVPISDGFYESLECDVLHFPTQGYRVCALPTIYNPHDLQHLHFPNFFSREDIAWRETIYPAGCHFARTVVVGSQWIKDDIGRQYHVSPDKIQIIPEAAPMESASRPTAESLAQVQRKYQLELPFVLFPAVTWPHKNHIRLLEAIATLRETRGLTIRLVCTGGVHKQWWPHVERRVQELRLQSQVKFLGFVSEEDIRALYALAEFLVMPSLFEASSLPVFDAWASGLPVASSDATAMPGQVLDAALLFDPYRIESIADALAKLATNEEFREDLKMRGYQRLKDFNLIRTAKAYRAVYRRAGGYPLTDEDRSLLQWDWMREPKRV